MTPMRLLSPRSWAALALAACTLPSHALFKVVAPDGSVTYTDRPPPASAGRQVPLGADAASGNASDALANLPIELRQTISRFPVTLYTSADCAPCESGRRLLQGRGVPFTERQVLDNDDAEALERLTGGRSLPSMTIGSQALRGFSEVDWQSYLDAAGYPRESRLPRGYQPPPATPLVARRPESPPPAAAPAPAPPPVALPPSTAPSPTGIRF